MSNVRGQHVNVLNFLRAIASLAVCAVHVHYCTELCNYPLESKIINFGQQGVAVFFVISGFIIPYSLWSADYETKDFFKYLLKRIIRIDPPYILTILLCFLVAGCKIDMVRLVLHAGYLIPFSTYDWYQSVFWTLGIEFQFYILIGILFTFIKKGNKYLIVLLLLIISFTGYFLPIESDFKFISRYIHYFCFGIMCYLSKQGKVEIWLCHLFFFILTTYLCIRISYITGLVGYFTAATILHIDFKTVLSDFLGKISYSLYLIHSLVAGLLAGLFSTFIHNPYLFFFLLINACVAFATLFYYVAERPALLYSKKIKVKNQ